MANKEVREATTFAVVLTSPAIVAHRGASKACRENTVAAFEEARRQGASMVEFDVRRTRDGVLVIHHDPFVAGVGVIIELDASALPNYVPTLVQALEACRGMEVNIEIKNNEHEPDFDPNDVVAGQVVELLAARDDVDAMLISSFHLATIDAVRIANPDVRTGFLFTMPPLSPLRLKASIHRTAAAGHVAIHPHHRGVTRRMVDEAHEMGLAVNVWTVDDPNRMRALALIGVDALITNVPAVGVESLRARHSHIGGHK